MKSFIIKLYLSILILTGINSIFNVHIIPHDHMALGQGHSFDEYYELNIFSKFNYILENLTLDNNRTFVITEIIYFIKWYNTELTSKTKTKLKNLINLNRIEFVLGGYILNNHFMSNYQDILEQIIYMMRFLKEKFNYTPKTAWYFDSLGVSSGNIHLLTTLDYNFLILEKIPYDIANELKLDNMTEFF